MMGKPMKILELHYPMIQFLIKCNMLLESQTVETHTITDKLQAKLPNLCNYNITVPRLDD